MSNIAQFENDFIERTYPSIVSDMSIAFAELVANSWDAGATRVYITIPDKKGEPIIIEDNGSGMTNDEFRSRWMVFAYNRVNHQGEYIELVAPDSTRIRRVAYGRNGVGRHSLVCFDDRYSIETWRDGCLSKYKIAVCGGDSAFSIENFSQASKDGHGTKISARVVRNLPDVDEMSSILSGRFLYDPSFVLKINGNVIDLANHKDIYLKENIVTENKYSLDITVIDSTKTAMKSQQHGIAFWVSGRLVGKPSWTYGNRQFLDGRSRVAKRFTVIVKSDDLANEILPDWTGFIEGPNMTYVYDAVENFVQRFIKDVMSEKREELQKDIIKESYAALDKLPIPAQREVSAFIETVTEANPLVNSDFMKLAIGAIASIQQSTKGEQLLRQLNFMNPEEIDKLTDLLDNWNVDDIMTVMDEIDKRIVVVEAIERLYESKNTDELHTLHPLVLNARWLFGPQYDSPMFTSNKALSTVIKTLFKEDEYDESQLDNPRKRPDIICLKRFSFKAVCTERNDGDIMKPDQVLIIELKRGGFKIEDDEVSQAQRYVRQLKKSSVLHKSAEITAYVVGAEIGDVNQTNNSEFGSTYVVTYGQLVQTAKTKLFNLKEKLKEHYD